MSAVDEKREIFAHAFITNMAGGMSRNKAAIAAAEAAGYRGKFIETNANRLLRHPRVKERIAELVAPAQQARERATIATVEMAQQKLSEIILANISLDAVKPADRIAAVRQLAAMMGWNAPTHINVNKHVSTDWSTAELVAFIADARNGMRRSRGGFQAARSQIKFTEYTYPRYQAGIIHEGFRTPTPQLQSSRRRPSWAGIRKPSQYKIAEQLERVERGEIDRLMLLVPPRHGKSEVASRRLPAFYLGKHPERYVSKLVEAIGTLKLDPPVEVGPATQ